jgi:hypothetical protein
MNKLDKIHGLFLLFVLLVLVLVINPRIIKNIYNSFLGRIILIIIVLFFAMNSMSLGLLTALVFIIASNMLFREGLEGNMDSINTTSDPNITSTIDTISESNNNTSSDTTLGIEDSSKDKEKTISAGVSVTDDTLVNPQNSNTLPVNLPGSSENVLPAESGIQAFQNMYAPF